MTLAMNLDYGFYGFSTLLACQAALKIVCWHLDVSEVEGFFLY